MKIAYVTPRYLPYTGGVEHHAAAIATRLVEFGHAVHVYTQEPDRGLPAEESIDGVIVHRYPVLLPPPVYAVSPGLPLALRRDRSEYDLMHLHSYHALAAPLAALVEAGPLVFTPHFHGSGHRPLGRLLHLPYRLVGGVAFRRAQAVICVSQSEAESVRRAFPSTANRLHVIPNGVDYAALQAAEPLPKTGNLLLSGGRLLAYKRFDLVIQALRGLPQSWSLAITGEGPERIHLESLVRSLGLADRVQFHGNVSRQYLDRLLRTADVYVGLSEAEAFGMGVAEAHAAGIGIVASDIAAHRDVLGTGEAGIELVPVHAPSTEIAAAILRATAQEARDTRDATLSWSTITERTLAVYEEVLTRSRNP